MLLRCWYGTLCCLLGAGAVGRSALPRAGSSPPKPSACWVGRKACAATSTPRGSPLTTRAQRRARYRGGKEQEAHARPAREAETLGNDRLAEAGRDPAQHRLLALHVGHRTCGDRGFGAGRGNHVEGDQSRGAGDPHDPLDGDAARGRSASPSHRRAERNGQQELGIGEHDAVEGGLRPLPQEGEVDASDRESVPLFGSIEVDQEASPLRQFRQQG